MEFGQNKFFREIDLFDFTRFFSPDFFKFSSPLLCTTENQVGCNCIPEIKKKDKEIIRPIFQNYLLVDYLCNNE